MKMAMALRLSAEERGFSVDADNGLVSTTVTTTKTPVVPSVVTISRLQDMMVIEDAWRDLEVRCQGAVFFQSFDWCHLIWRTKADLEVRIIVVGRAASAICNLAAEDQAERAWLFCRRHDRPVRPVQ